MGRYISTMLKRRRVSVLNTSSTFSGWAPSWTCETQTSPTSCDRRGCPPCRSPVSTCWSFALDQQRIWICRKNYNSRFSFSLTENVLHVPDVDGVCLPVPGERTTGGDSLVSEWFVVDFHMYFHNFPIDSTSIHLIQLRLFIWLLSYLLNEIVSDV